MKKQEKETFTAKCVARRVNVNYKLLIKVTICIFLAYILISVGLKVYRDWHTVKWNELTIHWIWLVPALGLPVLQYMFQAYIWQKILQMVGDDLPFSVCFNIFMKSQIGKYIPGKIGLVLTKVLESHRFGVSKQNALAAASYETAIHLYFMLFSSAAMLPFMIGQTGQIGPSKYALLIILVTCSTFFIYPRNFLKAINILFKIMNIERVEVEIPLAHFSRISLLVVLSALLSGLAGFAVISLLFDVGPSYFFYILGARNLAFLAGLVNIFSPSGIGVREGILVWLLSFIIPTPFAFASCIILRITSTATEWLMIAAAYMWKLDVPENRGE